MCLETIMKNNKLILQICLALVCFFCVSCSQTYYQVYTMKSDNLKMENNSLLFENADCKVSYNFWSEGGWVTFAFENKTNEDIFINMNESFLIVNGYAHNYFEDKTYTFGQVSTTTKGYGERLDISISGTTGFWSDKLYTASAGATANIISKSTSINYVTKKEEVVVCVPAKAYKTFMKFCLSPQHFQICEEKSDYPSKRVSIRTFEKNNSPILMKNRLTYGFKIDKMDKHVDNFFWLSEIENLPRKEALEETKEKDCKTGEAKKIKQFKIGGPAQFYNIYMRRVY